MQGLHYRTIRLSARSADRSNGKQANEELLDVGLELPRFLRVLRRVLHRRVRGPRFLNFGVFAAFLSGSDRYYCHAQITYLDPKKYLN